MIDGKAPRWQARDEGAAPAAGGAGVVRFALCALFTWIQAFEYVRGPVSRFAALCPLPPFGGRAGTRGDREGGVT